MDSIHLSESKAVVTGLADLMRDLLDAEEYVYSHVDMPSALFIVEVAKLADDRQDYFPRGKWATIQNIQARMALCLDIELAKSKEITTMTIYDAEPRRGA
jgi:hypothetical protein